jgi:hypothetical protein
VTDETIDLQTDVPHSARIYDYLLGGKDNFPADRAAADAITSTIPHLPTSMRANRHFMRRVIRYLAAEEGIRQFLDIGTGLPTAPNLHEVAQAVAPESRVVYVDNDPIVLVHARALLTSSPEGRTTYLDADLFEPEAILTAPELLETLDPDRPVALSLIAILQFIEDEDIVRDLIARLMKPLARGSVLAISTVCPDTDPESTAAGVRAYKAQGLQNKARTKDEIAALFDGMELIPPGVTMVHRWHPDETASQIPDEHVSIAGGIARKI